MVQKVAEQQWDSATYVDQLELLSNRFSPHTRLESSLHDVVSTNMRRGENANQLELFVGAAVLQGDR